MNFPKDFDWHKAAKVECKYKWSIPCKGVFEHKAVFRKEDKFFTHKSFNGELIEELHGDITFPMEMRVIVHNTKTFRYYSIPGNPWYEHFWGDKIGDNWDWVSIILNCGMSIVALDKLDDRLCDFTLNGMTVESEFILDNKHFYIYELGSYLTLEPVQQEVIFKPMHGRQYSETPFEVIAKGKVIGYGMREKTYKEILKRGAV